MLTIIEIQHNYLLINKSDHLIFFFINIFLGGEVLITDTSQLTGFKMNVTGKTRYATWIGRQPLECPLSFLTKKRAIKLFIVS